MITDDTILKRLDYREFDNNKSYTIARRAYYDILFHVFPSMGRIDHRETKDGIEIKEWWPGTCLKGICLSFRDYLEQRTCFRLIEFKGTAKDFKAKVLEKFEALKSLRQEAGEKYINQKRQEVADELEITELTRIAKRAFDKYQVTISKNMAGYRLTLEIDFNDKRELLKFCDLEGLV